MKKIVLGGFLLLSLIIVTLLVLPFFTGEQSVSGAVVDSGTQEESIGEENGVEASEGTVVQESPGQTTEGVGGGDAAGGGPSGGSGESQGSACASHKVSYGVSNLEKSSVCLQYDQSVCVDKSVTCFVEISNLDGEVGGLFGVSFVFTDQATGGSIVSETVLAELTVGPNTAEDFIATVSLQSQEEQGAANQEIECTYHTEEVPTREVCN